MTGVFNVDSFLTEASEIATAVGLSTTSSAESYEAEVSDFYPQSSAEIGNEQSGRGVPVAYGSGSSQYVEPPVVELEAELHDIRVLPHMHSTGDIDKLFPTIPAAPGPVNSEDLVNTRSYCGDIVANVDLDIAIDQRKQ